MRKNELNSVSFGPQNQHLVLHCFLWEEYNYFLNLLVFGHEFGPELDNAVSLSGSQMSVHFWLTWGHTKESINGLYCKSTFLSVDYLYFLKLLCHCSFSLTTNSDFFCTTCCSDLVLCMLWILFILIGMLWPLKVILTATWHFDVASFHSDVGDLNIFFVRICSTFWSFILAHFLTVEF